MTRSISYFPLTTAQRSIWQIVRFYPNSAFVNLAATVRIKERLDYGLLEIAINTVIKQNDALRTKIVGNGLEPKQYFAAYTERKVEVLDFNYPGGIEDFDNWKVERTRKLLNLFDSDLFDFAIVKIGEDEGAFYFKGHHIAADLWSMTLLASQILKHYYGLKQNSEFNCEDRPSYGDYALAEMESISLQRFEQHSSFWTRMVSTLPEFTTFNKDTVLSSTVAQRQTYVLAESITALINDFAKVYGLSPFCIFFAILAICIWRLTAKTDIVISTPVLNRSGIKEKSTMGMFINNVPFRIKVNPKVDFLAFARVVSKEWRTVLKHQKYPYDLVLKHFRERHGTSDRLSDVSFSFQNAKLGITEVDFEGKVVFNGEEINSLAVHIHDRQELGCFTVDYDFLADVFSDSDIGNLHEYIVNLLTTSLTSPGELIADLKFMSRAQENKLLVEFNGTESDIPQRETIVNRFERQAVIEPDKIALVFKNNSLTYQELNQRCNQLACLLRRQGVGKGSVVGIIVDRSIEMIVAILAILKAGGAYLPIDPTYPKERITYLIRDSKCGLILTYSSENFSDWVCDIVKIDLKNLDTRLESTENLVDGPGPNDLANVIYTSGSTGNPKGVMVEHCGLTNLTHAFSNIITPGYKTVLAITTVSFDIFFMETLFPLASGMKVVIADKEEANVPYLLLELVERHKVDFLQTTPSRLKLILNDRNAHKLSNLTDLIVGGESFPAQLLKDLRKVTYAQVINGYGPTEASVYSTIKELVDSDVITIGKPILNTKIYILDEDLRPVPIGGIGEVYISGLGVARGYINNEKLTEERFVPNPFIVGSRMYKTGDLAKWLNNGEIVYLGRNDNQVKIKGFRIELGEIEDRLRKHDSITEAVVVCRENKDQKKYLCAYLATNGLISTSELRDYLLRCLPDYMVPTQFIYLENLPLNPNGKIDRKALPEPVNPEQSERRYSAPRNELEQKMAIQWEMTLRVPKVGIDDNVFALGGDSLAILEILSGLFPNEWGLSAQDFYDYPTIRRLSDKICGKTDEQKVINTQPLLAINTLADPKLDDVTGNNFLLTGATGFLGIHILFELLTCTSRKVYCLIRGQEPKKRLGQLFNFYFPSLSADEYKDRIIIISGDISEANCGMAQADYQLVVKDVSSVIHTAALVKHYGNYEEFNKLNVHGTKELIEFCIRQNKELHYISTTSVSGSYLGFNPQSTRFTENDLDVGQNYHSNVYVRSKFEAETLIAKGIAVGLKAAIYRVGLLTGRYIDGHFQKNIEQNAFYRMLKSFIMLEALPQDFVQELLEFTPVDYCAKAIVKIMCAERIAMHRFHVFNHQSVKMAELIKVLKEAGIDLKTLPRTAFNSVVTSVSKTDSGRDILSGIISDPSLKGIFGTFSSVQVDSTLSVEFLKKLGFEWPEIQSEYLLKLLVHMQTTGFLKKISSVS